MHVPFNRPAYLPDHQNYLTGIGELSKLSSGGRYTNACEQDLEDLTGSINLLTPSATASLEMMALLIDLKPGDEIIVPSFTFVSTANAFSLRGAQILFADIDETGNITPKEIDRLAGPKTKAVCVVHYGGRSADMHIVKDLCQHKGLFLLEDAAQCAGANYMGQPLGSIGSLGCFSFHDTKNITSGEGGSLIVNDPRFIPRAEIIREKGTNRKAFLNGQVDKYTWCDLGSSYCISELNAAYLLPQIKKVDLINKKRSQICQSYNNQLTHSLESKGIHEVPCPSFNTSNFHMYALLAKDSEQRNEIIEKMTEHNVQVTSHYVPLHLSPFGKKYSSQKLPQSEDFAERILRLPLWFNMSDDHVEHVVSSFKKVLSQL